MKPRIFTVAILLFFLPGGHSIFPASQVEKGKELTRRLYYKKAQSAFEKAIKRNPRQVEAYYGLGITSLMLGHQKKALKALNKAVEISPYSLPEIDKHFLSLMTRGGFKKENITQRTFTVEDIQYLSRQIIYKNIANFVTRSYRSDREKIMALFNWTSRNISPPCRRKDFAAYPLDIMKRGYGSCGRSAWVLTTLAQQLGFKTHIFYLRDPKTSALPHTVAQIYLEGKWALFDPYKRATFPSSEGDLAGVNEIILNPELLTDVYPPRWKESFRKGMIRIGFEPQGYLPRMKVLQGKFKEFLNDPPLIYYDLEEEVSFAFSSLTSSRERPLTFYAFRFPVPDKEYVMGIWVFPFLIRLYYLDGGFYKEMERELPQFTYYESGRILYLLGYYGGAIEEFRKILKEKIPPEAREDIVYFLSLCYLESGNYREAIMHLENYLKEYPRGAWDKKVRELLNFCRAKLSGKKAR